MSKEELARLIRLAAQLGLTHGEVLRLIGDPQRISFEEAYALMLKAAPARSRGARPEIGM